MSQECSRYLANKGYVALAVNYRLGIGYGHDFHHPAHAADSATARFFDRVFRGVKSTTASR